MTLYEKMCQDKVFAASVLSSFEHHCDYKDGDYDPVCMKLLDMDLPPALPKEKLGQPPEPASEPGPYNKCIPSDLCSDAGVCGDILVMTKSGRAMWINRDKWDRWNATELKKPLALRSEIDASPTVPPRNEKPCSLCNIEQGRENVLQDGNWMHAEIKRIESYYLIVRGEGTFEMHLDYCPKCGRKLSKE